MNLIFVGGMFLGAVFSGPEASQTPVEKASLEATISQPAQLPGAPDTSAVQRTARGPAAAPTDRGWMRRETSVDQKTGATTEINVIGFAD